MEDPVTPQSSFERSFKYRNLDVDNIRLLRVDRDAHSAEPAFSLEHHSRCEAPSYVAISYEWGDDSASKTIRLDGTTFFVRPNLWWCLHYIHRFYDESYLWVDAICINQENILERNEQVGRMDQTYSDAVAVIAWVGIEAASEEEEEEERIERYPIPIPWINDPFVSRSSYWSRIWILQELFHARNVMVMRGRDRHMGLDSFYLEEMLSFPSLFNFGWALTQFTRWRLSYLLQRCRSSQCKDPRDRFFALLSVLRKQDQEILGCFFPDYSMSVEKVQLIALAFCEQDGMLSEHRRSESFGIHSKVLWRDLLREASMDDRVKAAKPPKMWTWHFLVQYLFWNRSAELYDERKRECERLRREWIDMRIDALRNIAVTSLR